MGKGLVEVVAFQGHTSQHLSGRSSKPGSKEEVPVSLVDCSGFLNRGNVMIKFVF